MFLPHSSLFARRAAAIIFTLSMAFGLIPRALIASPPLPNVTPEMERPEFWTKKIENPTKLLLTPENIRRMNEENLKRPDLRLCGIKDLKEDWSRKEILSFLDADRKDFGRTEEAKTDFPSEKFFGIN